MTWTIYNSPFGPLTLAGRAGALRNVYFPGRAPSLSEANRDPVAFTDAAAQLDEYFAGERYAAWKTISLAM
jgi:methylated-DNA-[protein]-cysteine S-methyltransferase